MKTKVTDFIYEETKYIKRKDLKDFEDLMMTCFYTPEDVEDEDGYVQDFRHSIIFPLERYYDKLYNFIHSILDDDIMEPSHRNILIKKIERDILQTYFRVCSFDVGMGGKNHYYQLQLFKTEKYNPDSFYRINNLYIEKNLFQYKDLDFYQKTT